MHITAEARPSRFGYRMALVGAAIMFLGGMVDLLLPELLPSHERFLGTTGGATPPATASLVLLLLHTLGAALVALSLAIAALLVVSRSTGLRWPAVAAAIAALFAEGMNALAIARAGSRVFVGPAVAALLVAGGVAWALASSRASATEHR